MLSPHIESSGLYFPLNDVIADGAKRGERPADVESVWRLRCPRAFKGALVAQDGRTLLTPAGIRSLARSCRTERLRALSVEATVTEFLTMETIRYDGARCTPDALFGRYLAFCSRVDASPLSMRGLTLALQERGYTRTRSHAHPAWCGVGL